MAISRPCCACSSRGRWRLALSCSRRSGSACTRAWDSAWVWRRGSRCWVRGSANSSQRGVSRGEEPARAAGYLRSLALAGVALALLLALGAGVQAWTVLSAVGVGALGPGLLSSLWRRRAETIEGAKTVSQSRKNRPQESPHVSLDSVAGAGAQLVSHGKWTLPGMAVTWGQNTGYAWLVALVLGSAAVADLPAARLFVMPLTTLLAAWSRVFVPRAAARVAAQDAASVRAMARNSGILLLAVAVGWVLCVAIFFAASGGRILPARYAGLASIVAAWCSFALVNAVRFAASQMLVAHARFRALFHYSAIAAACGLVLVLLLVRLVGTCGSCLWTGRRRTAAGVPVLVCARR